MILPTMESGQRFRRLYRLFTKPSFFICLGILLLSTVSFLGQPMGNDEGVWAYIGRIWVDHGLLPYTGAIENKATMVYMVYGLSHFLFSTNIWFPRFLAIAAVLTTALLVFFIGKHISNRRAAIIAMAMMVLIMPLQSVDGGYAETESFMNVFRAVTFLLTFLAYRKTTKPWLMVLSGVSFACAISSKQLAVTDVIPLMAFHYVLAGKHINMAFRHLLFVAAGTIAGTGITLIPYLASGGTLGAYIDGAWKILLQSGSSPHSIVSRIAGFFRHFFNVRLAFHSLGIAGFLLLRKQLARSLPLYLPLLVWVIVDFLAYNADGWYLDHHYKVFIPSWSLAFGIVIDAVLSMIADKEKEIKVFVVGIAALLAFYIPFEPSYFQSVRKFLKGNVHDESARDLGLYLKKGTQPGAFVYIWGFHMGPAYYYSDRVAPSRYFSEPFLGRPGALEEVQRDMAAHPPVLVAIPLEKYPLPAWLQDFLDHGYHREATMYGHDIYRQHL
jgi:hypothetical protein